MSPFRMGNFRPWPVIPWLLGLAFALFLIDYCLSPLTKGLFGRAHDWVMYKRSCCYVCGLRLRGWLRRRGFNV